MAAPKPLTRIDKLSVDDINRALLKIQGGPKNTSTSYALTAPVSYSITLAMSGIASGQTRTRAPSTPIALAPATWVPIQLMCFYSGTPPSGSPLQVSIARGAIGGGNGQQGSLLTLATAALSNSNVLSFSRTQIALAADTPNAQVAARPYYLQVTTPSTGWTAGSSTLCVTLLFQ